jgi:hypothetical protein
VQAWELNTKRKLTHVLSMPVDASPVGGVANAHWLPLPPPLDRGCVASALLTSGALALIDLSKRQPSHPTPSSRARSLRTSLSHRGEPPPARAPLIDLADSPGNPFAEDKQDAGQPRMARAPCCQSLLCLPAARLALVRLIVQARSFPAVLQTRGGVCYNCSPQICANEFQVSLAALASAQKIVCQSCRSCIHDSKC